MRRASGSDRWIPERAARRVSVTVPREARDVGEVGGELCAALVAQRVVADEDAEQAVDVDVEARVDARGAGARARLEADLGPHLGGAAGVAEADHAMHGVVVEAQ